MSWRKDALLGEPLTAREREIVSAVAQGWGNADIGEILFIDERTVRTHCSHIIAKLGARNRTDAARIARETGLLDGMAIVVEPPQRYHHRNGGQEPPEIVGFFFTEIDGTSERDFIQFAKAPWGEWRMRRLGSDWEAYQPEVLRASGTRFWGPVVAPWEE